MTRGRQIGYLAGALGALLGGVGVCAFRERLPTVLVVLLVLVALACTALLVRVARRTR